MTNCVSDSLSLSLSLSVAVVGLERTAYTVSEDVVMVEVCAIVYSPNNSCPINFPFDVRLATEDVTAGKPHHHSNKLKNLTMLSPTKFMFELKKTKF